VISFKSIFSRIIFLHVIAVVIVAIVMPLVLFWFVRSAANDLHDQAMREQADAVARHLVLRPDGGWTLDLPPALEAIYSPAYGRYAYAVLDDTGKVLFSSLRDSLPVFPQDFHSSPHSPDVTFMATGKGGSAMSGVSLAKEMSGRTVWVQVGEDFSHRDVIIDDIVADFFRRVAWIVLPMLLLLLAIDIGGRTLAMAQRFVHHVAQVLSPDCAPLFLTDGFREYLTALLTHYGQWVQPARRRAQGPAPKPRWMPLPQLLYAQVIKTVRRRRLVRVSHRVVFGTLEAAQQVLAACGWQINTAFIERVNLSIRQHVAAVGRRVTTLCKGEVGMRQQLVLYHVYYNFGLPHASLRVPLAAPLPTNGTGSATQWQLRTPAMAAGLTDHVWTLREVLLFRVPPWPQPAGV